MKTHRRKTKTCDEYKNKSKVHLYKINIYLSCRLFVGGGGASAPRPQERRHEFEREEGQCIGRWGVNTVKILKVEKGGGA